MRHDRARPEWEPNHRDITRMAAEFIVKTAADALARELRCDPGRARGLLVDCLRLLEDES